MKKVFLTVDVECHDAEKENLYIWGENSKGFSGLKQILDIGKEYGIPINFFVDIGEMRYYGKPFIEKIINLIKEYNQPIYLHVHPEYISDKRNRFFWQYSNEEQKQILAEGINMYRSLFGMDPKSFRAGGYGASPELYNHLHNLVPEIIDLSYKYENGKMCHISKEEFGVSNIRNIYKGVKCIPNASFIGLDLFGIKRRIGVDAAEMRYTEFKEFIEKANGNDFVLTMHSWHFIDKVLWNKNRASLNISFVKKFASFVNVVKKNGYTFEKVENAEFNDVNNLKDFDYNAAETVIHKIRSLILNFFRFQNMAKISKKYLIIFASFYAVCILIIISTIMFLM